MGTSNWPKPGTSTWPPADTFSRPRTVGPDLMPLYVALREHAPEAFSQEQVNLDLLATALGIIVDAGPEHYGLSFPGKAEALLASQRPSIASVQLDEKKSVHSAETRN